MRQRKKESLKHKHLIMNAAIKLFAQNGYHAAKIDDIVEKAGFSKGTFYYYFNSKEDILLEIIDQKTSLLNEKIDNLNDSNLNFMEMLKLITEAKIDFFKKNRNFFCMIMGGAIRQGQRIPVSVGNRIQEFVSGFNNKLKAIFARFENEFRNDFTLNEIVLLYINLTDASFRFEIFDNSVNSNLRKADKMVSVFLNGVNSVKKGA